MAATLSNVDACSRIEENRDFAMHTIMATVRLSQNAQQALQTYGPHGLRGRAITCAADFVEDDEGHDDERLGEAAMRGTITCFGSVTSCNVGSVIEDDHHYRTLSIATDCVLPTSLMVGEQSRDTLTLNYLTDNQRTVFWHPCNDSRDTTFDTLHAEQEENRRILDVVVIID